MTRAPWLSIAIALGTGCGGGRAAPDGGPPHDGPGLDAAIDAPLDAGIDAAEHGYVRQPPVTIPPAPPPTDLSGYPTDEQGRPILASGENYYLYPREPDPLTARSDCAAMIVRCVDRTVQGRSLDACAISPPRCATAEPWLEAACCPTACVDHYEQLRTDGQAPIAAFRAAFYGLPSCFPGVDALLGGAP